MKIEPPEIINQTKEEGERMWWIGKLIGLIKEVRSNTSVRKEITDAVKAYVLIMFIVIYSWYFSLPVKSMPTEHYMDIARFF